MNRLQPKTMAEWYRYCQSMNNPEKPSALSDQQIIEKIAINIMGWEFQFYHSVDSEWVKDGKHQAFVSEWNPLTDWNHWRQVERKLMENERLFKCYLWQLRDEEELGYSATTAQMQTAKADLRTRCTALLSVLSEKDE